ncbi:MAG: hypothetical protein R2882_15230 [Gemmatimonadales bacterium]
MNIRPRARRITVTGFPVARSRDLLTRRVMPANRVTLPAHGVPDSALGAVMLRGPGPVDRSGTA